MLRKSALCIFLLAAGACASPAPEATPTRPPIFDSLQPSAPPAATASPGPAAVSSPPPFRPTAPSDCSDNASFIEDLTIPDGTRVLAGESLDKRWSVRNSGSCDWGPDYRLVQIGSTDIQGPAEAALYPAQAGTTAVWQLALVAPAVPGEYLGRWQAQAPDGTPFGEEVFVLIVVDEPQPTSTPTSAVTPTP